MTIVALTSAEWADFVELMGGEQGGCGGCWCTWWRLSRASWTQHSKAQRKNLLHDSVINGRSVGVLMRNAHEAEGWCAVAPMADYPTLLRSPVAYPIDDMPTWVISCLFIKAPYRRQGKMSQLIQGASEYAFAQGAAAVDGFPQTSNAEGKHVDRFVGVEGSFIRAGFRRIEVRGPHRVAVRKERP